MAFVSEAETRRGARQSDALHIGERMLRVGLRVDKLEQHCAIRMQELGIPEGINGQPDYGGSGKWYAFDCRATRGRETTAVNL
jgi:hypothetical protein